MGVSASVSFDLLFGRVVLFRFFPFQRRVAGRRTKPPDVQGPADPSLFDLWPNPARQGVRPLPFARR